MRARLLAAAILLWASALSAAPAYSSAGIVNAADNQQGFLAPNTIATVYGTGLAYGVKALTPDDIRGGVLPVVLAGTGTRVLVGGIIANPFYVSPLQINFLVPPSLLPGPSTVQIVLDSSAGPEIPIQITAAAPALFQLDAQNVVATHVDGSLVSSDKPAQPGDYVVLYATGLGQTTPPVAYREVPLQAAPLKQIADFKLSINSSALDSGAVTYAGVAPGLAGVYQINVRLPNGTDSNPEIRIGIGDQMSKAGLKLAVASPASTTLVNE